jgi:GTP-binding protein
MSALVFSAEEIESGRKLFAADWNFALASGSPQALPAGQGLEIAFAGRSNVGKSSLINALTGKKALARTSHTPGRTQELIFFRSGGRLVLVDMPGYGFAKAPKAKVAGWTALMHAYLKGRTNLARVYVLVDARHGLKPVDHDLFDLLDRSALSYQVVLTKCDLVPTGELVRRVTEVESVLAKHPAAFPYLTAASSHTGAGIPELRGAVARLLRERTDEC